ncbi:MAG: SLBB domain-containing protein, partial [Bacteroidota bacterium]
RDGRLLAVADLYDYLLRGFTEDEVRLQDNDRVFVPPRLKTVHLDGAVRRPAIYELHEDEGLSDVLRFAGGLQAEAYLRRFQIERVVPFAERTDPAVARTVLDLDLTPSLDTGAPRPPVALFDGDAVMIFSIVEADALAGQQRVPVASVAGAVLKPGRYEIGASVRTLRDLISEAEGLTGDAYPVRADLVRLNGDLERELVSLRLDEILADVPQQNLILQPQDSLYVYSEAELKADRIVTVSGQVLDPGEYPLLEQMTVGDLLFQAGGLTDEEFLKEVFLGRADLFRQSADGRMDEIIRFDLGQVLDGEGIAQMALRPQDEIRVYAAAVEEIEERFVTISGSVEEPGEYLYRDNMSLEDLILQAGGFTEDASLDRIEITRPRNGEASVLVTNVQLAMGGETDAFQFGLEDSLAVLASARRYPLQHRDRIYVRPRSDFRDQRVVVIEGEVRFPGEYTLLRENERLSEVVARAGGILSSGYIGGGRLEREGQQVIVEMEQALRGRRADDIILAPNDRIFIPATPNTVAVRGNVGLEGLIKYAPRQRVSYYLDRAGGTREESETIYLTQPSGATFLIKRGLFRKGPVVEDGAVILVTRKPPQEDRERIEWGRIITDTFALVSSALTIIVLARRANN